MFLGVKTTYFGEVDIEMWEYSLLLIYLLLFYALFARRKNVQIRKFPEYKYMLKGYLAKVAGAIGFCLIYFYYYGGGDTTNYFYSAMALSNLAKTNVVDYLTVLFGPNTVEMRQYFTPETGYPYYFVYYEARAYMVVRITSLVQLISFNSFLISTLIFSTVSYLGVFRFYRTLVSYYPSLKFQLAVVVIFMPSSIFWGSGILKDTITFSAVCWYLHVIDNIFFKKRELFFSTLVAIISTLLIVAIKPYIIMVLIPATMVWLLYFRIQKIRSTLIKYLLIPMMTIGLLWVSLYILTGIGGYLDKFSLDNALKTIAVSQSDLKRSEQYGTGYFDLGEMDGTWQGVISKAPTAIFAALFRPYLWESSNIVMVLAGLENLVVFWFFVRTIIRGMVVRNLKLITKNPLLLTFFIFSITYAFVIGISTPNFGALVRFKIPLLPLFMPALVISNYILKVRRKQRKAGRRFDYNWFVRGEPRSMPKSPV